MQENLEYLDFAGHIGKKILFLFDRDAWMSFWRIVEHEEGDRQPYQAKGTLNDICI